MTNKETATVEQSKADLNGLGKKPKPASVKAKKKIEERPKPTAVEIFLQKGIKPCLKCNQSNILPIFDRLCYGGEEKTTLDIYNALEDKYHHVADEIEKAGIEIEKGLEDWNNLLTQAYSARTKTAINQAVVPAQINGDVKVWHKIIINNINTSYSKFKYVTHNYSIYDANGYLPKTTPQKKILYLLEDYREKLDQNSVFFIERIQDFKMNRRTYATIADKQLKKTRENQSSKITRLTVDEAYELRRQVKEVFASVLIQSIEDRLEEVYTIISLKEEEWESRCNFVFEDIITTLNKDEISDWELANFYILFGDYIILCDNTYMAADAISMYSKALSIFDQYEKCDKDSLADILAVLMRLITQYIEIKEYDIAQEIAQTTLEVFRCHHETTNRGVFILYKIELNDRLITLNRLVEFKRHNIEYINIDGIYNSLLIKAKNNINHGYFKTPRFVVNRDVGYRYDSHELEQKISYFKYGFDIYSDFRDKDLINNGEKFVLALNKCIRNIYSTCELTLNCRRQIMILCYECIEILIEIKDYKHANMYNYALFLKFTAELIEEFSELDLEKERGVNNYYCGLNRDALHQESKAILEVIDVDL